MKPITEKLFRFLVSEDGSTAVQIVVLLAVIAIFCLAVFSSLSNSTQ